MSHTAVSTSKPRTTTTKVDCSKAGTGYVYVDPTISGIGLGGRRKLSSTPGCYQVRGQGEFRCVCLRGCFFILHRVPFLPPTPQQSPPHTVAQSLTTPPPPAIAPKPFVPAMAKHAERPASRRGRLPHPQAATSAKNKQLVGPTAFWRPPSNAKRQQQQQPVRDSVALHHPHTDSPHITSNHRHTSHE